MPQRLSYPPDPVKPQFFYSFVRHQIHLRGNIQREFLAYFLESRLIPKSEIYALADEILEVAYDGRLSGQDVRKASIARMLDDLQCKLAARICDLAKITPAEKVIEDMVASAWRLKIENSDGLNS